MTGAADQRTRHRCPHHTDGVRCHRDWRHRGWHAYYSAHRALAWKGEPDQRDQYEAMFDGLLDAKQKVVA